MTAVASSAEQASTSADPEASYPISAGCARRSPPATASLLSLLYATLFVTSRRPPLHWRGGNRSRCSPCPLRWTVDAGAHRHGHCPTIFLPRCPACHTC